MSHIEAQALGVTVIADGNSIIIRYVVPLPPKTLSANYNPASRQGRMARAMATRQYRYAVQTNTRLAMDVAAGAEVDLAPASIKAIKVSMNWYLVPCKGDNLYRPRDIGNAIAASKALFDGITDTGLIPDDTARYLSVGFVDLYDNARIKSLNRACEQESIKDPHIEVWLQIIPKDTQTCTTMH
jgi:hypothetical protein